LASGDQSEVEPPGPIPNPEVKRFSANGSETIGLVRVGRRQVYAPSMETWSGLFFCPDCKLLDTSRWKAGFTPTIDHNRNDAKIAKVLAVYHRGHRRHRGDENIVTRVHILNNLCVLLVLHSPRDGVVPLFGFVAIDPRIYACL
jgi:hypothetical protein